MRHEQVPTKGWAYTTDNLGRWYLIRGAYFLWGKTSIKIFLLMPRKPAFENVLRNMCRFSNMTSPTTCMLSVH